MPAPAPLLSHPDEVTPDWLTEALTRSGRVAPGHRVVDLDAVTIGNGKVGQNIRFGLTWEPTDAPGADQLPPSVVGKFASDDETSRMAGMLTGTYLREWAFYSELADPTRMAVPSCHVAELDAASGAFVLLFDDVTPAEAGDQIAGCSVDEAALALAELGRLHAYWWADPRLDGRDWLVRRGHDGGQGLADLYQAFVGSFLDRFGDRLTPEAAAVAERFTPLVTDWVSATPSRSRCSTATTGWRTCSSAEAPTWRPSPSSTGRPRASVPAPATPPTSWGAASPSTTDGRTSATCSTSTAPPSPPVGSSSMPTPAGTPTAWGRSRACT